MLSKARFTPDRAVLLAVLSSVALYCRDLRYDFILDDLSLILMNQTIASWRNWKLVFVHHIFYSPGPQVPVEFTAIHYRPVYTLWLMLNQSLFGAVVPWWHLTSLLLHVCVVFLVYRVGSTILRDDWTAATAALLFALHPIHVESVSYVSASTDLLVTVFLLISFLLYAKCREQQSVQASILIFVSSLAFAALAMFSKESAMAYPLLLAAYEMSRSPKAQGSGWWKRALPILPFCVIVAIYGMVRLVLFGPNLGPGPGISRVAALVYAPLVLLLYSKNLVWPWPLSFYYPIEWVWQWTALKVAVILLLLIAVTAGCVWFRKRPEMRLLLLWTAILFIVPTMAVVTFVREDWVHDRHMYLLSVPFCLLIAALLMQVCVAVHTRIVAIALTCAVLFVAASVQLGRFSDANSLYAATLKVAPRNVLAHQYRAFALWNYDEREEALREFRTTTELSPADPLVHAGYAGALAEIGQNEQAAAEYEKALQCSPRANAYRAYLFYRLAELELKLSDRAEATAHISEALQIAPQQTLYLALLAQIVEQQRDIDQTSPIKPVPQVRPASMDSHPAR